MAGHSKWSNIKHRKARQDAKKGKIFTTLIKSITVAAQQGGGNSEDNPKLRLAVEKALHENMTRDTINRAIDRGAGNNDADNLEELIYEGYGAGGGAILVEVLTDNRNRSAAEIRHAFSKKGGNLATSGSVSYLFSKQGQFYFETSKPDEILETTLSLDIEDFIQDETGVTLITAPDNFFKLQQKLIELQLTPTAAEITMAATTTLEVDNALATKIMQLIDALEEVEDVSNVYTNVNLDNGTVANSALRC